MKQISNLQLGLRTVVLLAFVAASTLVLVRPELLGGPPQAASLAIGALPALLHH